MNLYIQKRMQMSPVGTKDLVPNSCIVNFGEPCCEGIRKLIEAGQYWAAVFDLLGRGAKCSLCGEAVKIT